jgi:hypothetical protein
VVIDLRKIDNFLYNVKLVRYIKSTFFFQFNGKNSTEVEHTKENGRINSNFNYELE